MLMLGVPLNVGCKCVFTLEFLILILEYLTQEPHTQGRLFVSVLAFRGPGLACMAPAARGPRKARTANRFT